MDKIGIICKDTQTSQLKSLIKKHKRHLLQPIQHVFFLEFGKIHVEGSPKTAKLTCFFLEFGKIHVEGSPKTVKLTCFFLEFRKIHVEGSPETAKPTCFFLEFWKTHAEHLLKLLN